MLSQSPPLLFELALKAYNHRKHTIIKEDNTTRRPEGLSGSSSEMREGGGGSWEVDR